MGINVLQKWLGLLFFFLNSYAGYFEVFKFTKPCRINTSCDLPCRLDPSKLGTVNVLWYNDDHEILSQGKEIRKHYRNLRIEMPALNEWNLRIIKVSRNFEGIYRCKTNEGDILSEITVVIEDKPKVDETKSSSVREFVTEADVATLNCIFSGFPEPKISWYRGNKEEEIEGIKGHQLVIRNVSRYATDYYTCVATNKNGNAKWYMTLIVKFAPTVSVMDETVYAVEGQEVEMGCMVQTSPILSVYWTFNDENVHNLDKYEVEEEKESDIFPVRFVRLRIKRGRLSLRDQGDYACHGFGEDEKPIVAETTLKVFKNSNETSQKVHEKDDSL